MTRQAHGGSVLSTRRGWRRARVYIAPGRESWHRRFCRDDVHRPLSGRDDLETIHVTSKSRVFRVPGGTAGLDSGAGVFVKEEKYRRLALLWGLTTRPRVAREYDNLQELRDAGLAAVDGLSYGVESIGPFYPYTFLLTEEFADAESLKNWSRAETGKRPNARAVHEALSALVTGLGALHDRGRFVRTLYAKNILVRGSEQKAELCLCDVPRVSGSWLAMHRRWYARFDLACLDKWASQVFSRTDRLRLLNRYFEARQMTDPAVRREWIIAVLNQSRYLRHESGLGRFRKKVRQRLLKYGLKRFVPF